MKRNYLLCFLFAIIFSFFHIGNVNAAPLLNVEADIGIDNHIKNYTPVPLKLTITNSGTDFSGDLVIDTAVSYNVGSALVYPLDIAGGETKTIQFYLDGLSEEYIYMNPQQDFFYFYEGGVEKGKVVDFTGDKFLRPTSHDRYETFIYTLTENSDRLAAFLRLGQNSTFNVQTFHLNQMKDFEFPLDPKGMEIANILAVDEMSISSLTEKEQQVIFDWVQQGGILLLGASDQLEASVGLFKEYLPLDLSNNRITLSSKSLEYLSNGGKFPEDIEIFQSQKTEKSMVVFEDQNKIVAAISNLGKGHIIQTTFSLGDQPLATMDGYPKLLVNILQLNGPNPVKGAYSYIGNYMDYLPYEVGNINEIFPSFEISVTSLVIIVFIYILIIGPILYLILKKFDKREHAWWIIPAVSIALSILLFIIGAKDRLLESQIQQTAYYQVNEDKSLSGYYIESILTNRGGDFTFQLDENTTAMATRNSNYGNPGNLGNQSYVSKTANGSTLTLKNLKYWSVQSFIGQSKIQNAGNLDIQLSVKNKTIVGEITNNFPFELKDVVIWSGAKEISLGNIKAGETLDVSVNTKNSLLQEPTTANYSYTYPRSKEEILPMRLEKAKFGAGSLAEGGGLPVVIGWTDQPITNITLEGNATVSSASYIVQTFKPEVEFVGEVTLDKDILIESVDLLNQTGFAELVNESTNQWYLEDGDYTYFVDIPKDLVDKAVWTEIAFKNKHKSVTASIWNPITNELEPISDSQATFDFTYLNESNRIRFQVHINNSQPGAPVVLPEIEIKGVAK